MSVSKEYEDQLRRMAYDPDADFFAGNDDYGATPSTAALYREFASDPQCPNREFFCDQLAHFLEHFFSRYSGRFVATPEGRIELKPNTTLADLLPRHDPDDKTISISRLFPDREDRLPSIADLTVEKFEASSEIYQWFRSSGDPMIRHAAEALATACHEAELAAPQPLWDEPLSQAEKRNVNELVARFEARIRVLLGILQQASVSESKSQERQEARLEAAQFDMDYADATARLSERMNFEVHLRIANSLNEYRRRARELR